MGYFINVLLEGEQYDLNGDILKFIKKVGDLYYFYACELDELRINYIVTDKVVRFKGKDLTFIKRKRTNEATGWLEKIGCDKFSKRRLYDK